MRFLTDLSAFFLRGDGFFYYFCPNAEYIAVRRKPFKWKDWKVTSKGWIWELHTVCSQNQCGLCHNRTGNGPCYRYQRALLLIAIRMNANIAFIKKIDFYTGRNGKCYVAEYLLSLSDKPAWLDHIASSHNKV